MTSAGSAQPPPLWVGNRGLALALLALGCSAAPAPVAPAVDLDVCDDGTVDVTLVVKRP